MAPKTNTKVVSSLKGKSVDIIEFGQELFNKNSIVLMPGKGGDKDIVTSDYDKMKKIIDAEGLVGLAAIYKQFSFDSRKRLILTGHSDPGGDIPANFNLSKARAESIYCLLTDNKKRWGELARKRHTIRDYKWIMAYFYFTMSKEFRDDTSCDPGKIDDTWDSDNKTRDAVRGFFKGVKKIFAVDIDDVEMAKKVEEDDKKRWPEYMWQAVFILYQRKIRKMLDLDRAGMKKFREKKLKFAEAGKEFLGCGYSFPMKTPDDSQYQKEKYRRVEALLFYLNDVPAREKGKPKIVCSPANDKLHVEKDCPFYHDKHFIANYLNPLEEMNMIAYHMKFNAYNPISLRNGYPRNRRIPEGLTIQAVHYPKKGGKRPKVQIKTITKFHDGIYTAKIPDDKDRKDLYFEFSSVTQQAPKLERLWIYTKDKDTEPVLVKKFDKDIEELMTPDKYHERLCYYDLPYEWRSGNYFTRFEMNGKKYIDRFQYVLKKWLKLKPYGTNESDAENPLAFSLNDIVLMDKDGNQEIKDQDQNGNSKELSAKSRISLFYVKDDDLVLYRPRKDSTDALPAEESAFYSQLDFKKEKKEGAEIWRNAITSVPSHTRGIMFCGKFYSVWDKRAGQKAGTWKPGEFQIKGCRAAVLEDTKTHYAHIAKYTNTATHYRYFCDGVGNYETHYIHLACAKEPPDTYKGGFKVRSFLMVYWNGRVVKNQKALDPNKASIKNYNLTNTDIENFSKLGFRNAKKRWEEKGYTLEPVTLDAEKKGNIQIKPVYFFEPKTADRGGKHKCTFNVSNDESDGDMGVSRANLYYLDYKYRNYQNLNPHEYTEIDASTYKVLVVAHELGHAQGLDDDYAYHTGHVKTTDDGYFGQYYLGMPYQDDLGSLMKSNRAPRTKHLYQIMNGLNDCANDDNKLKKLLNGTYYQGIFRYTKTGAEKALKFNLAKSPNDYRNIYAPFKSKRGLSTGTGKVDVALYKMGEDEMVHSIKIGPTPPGPIQRLFGFDGILPVFIKIGFDFKNYTDNSDPANPINNAWTWGDTRTWMANVTAEIKNLNNRFYLSGTNNDFKNTYIYFFPLCLHYLAINNKYKDKATGTNAQKIAAGNAAETATRNGANITIEVTLNNKTEASARTSPLTTLKVGNSVSPKWIAKAVLGKDPGVIQGKTAAWTAWPNPTAVQAKFVKADFDFIKNWVNSASCLNGGAFQVKGS